jgi:hypothetical protein
MAGWCDDEIMARTKKKKKTLMRHCDDAENATKLKERRTQQSRARALVVTVPIRIAARGRRRYSHTVCLVNRYERCVLFA